MDMQEIHRIRVLNLKRLIKMFGGVVAFCNKADMSENYISRVKCGKKNLGESLARKIEQSFGLPHLWLDATDSANQGVDSAIVKNHADMELLNAIKKLSPTHRKIVLDMVMVLTDKQDDHTSPS